ncbi:MAG: hypothetical protein ACRD1P_04000 [Thermoanaerobaculia bacterium]
MAKTMLGGQKYEERSTLKQGRLAPAPIVRPVDRSRACRPYVLQSKCAQGGEDLTEENAWEHRRWLWDRERNNYVLSREFLCTAHAVPRRNAYREGHKDG